MYKVGLVGLPNIGKSSIFSLLTKKKILIANYPFATIEPNKGVVNLVEPELDLLASFWKSEKKVASSIQLIDIAGLIGGASKNAGLGNEFLSYIRETDLVLLVVRCFEDKKIVHVENRVDPWLDYQTIKEELFFSDLQQVEKRIRLCKKIEEKKVFLELKKSLENFLFFNETFNLLNLEEKRIIKSCNLLTLKPWIVLANYSGDNKEFLQLKNKIKELEKKDFLAIPVRLVEEFSKLTNEEKKELREEVANDIFLEETFLQQLTTKLKESLNLKSFFTAGPIESRSWLIEKEKNARSCSGLIHSDIEKKFIAVEVYNYLEILGRENLVKNSMNIKTKKEGANYLIRDGEVCFFYFNKN